MYIQQFIKQKRKENKLSQQKLAELAGVGRRSLQYWESGAVDIPADKADTILRILGESYTLGTNNNAQDSALN